MTLILASRSVPRQHLLAQLGWVFECQPADVDETPLVHESPMDYTVRVATAKAQAVAALRPDAVVVAADTPVIVGRTILQTPTTPAQAAEMLRRQSGRRVTIPTVVVVAGPGGVVRHCVVRSWVKLKVLSAHDVAVYVDSGHWQASGGLKIEHIEPYVMQMQGSYSGIMGLPLYETARLLAPYVAHLEKKRA